MEDKPWYMSNKLWTAFGAIVSVVLVNVGFSSAVALTVSASIVSIAVALIAGRTSQKNAATRAAANMTPVVIFKSEPDSEAWKEIAELRAAIAKLESKQ